MRNDRELPPAGRVGRRDAELRETTRLLLRDVDRTAGAEHAQVVHAPAARVAALDLGSGAAAKLVDDVQQHLQDTFVDTAWPACPRHPNHPLSFVDGAWCCPRDGSAVHRLGALPEVG